jgi:hypothetical protein
VRVPAALAISHAIDTLSVAVDPASFGLTELTAHAGSVIGVEAQVSVFPRDQRQAQRLVERRTIGPGVNFDVSSISWSTAQDGVPTPGMRYVVEMQLVVFETNVPETKAWNPHAGNFRTLWVRTLRQAEE